MAQSDSMLGTPLIAAFSVEDRVQFAVAPLGRLPRGRWKIPLLDDRIQAVDYDEEIDTNSGDYFAAVREHIYRCLKQCYLHFQEKSEPGGTVSARFREIQIITVSIPGVIENARAVKQLPLWTWPTTPRVTWRFNNRVVLDFDIPFEITEVLKEIASEMRDDDFAAYAQERGASANEFIEVYNDCAAAAAAEVLYRSEVEEPGRRFIFIKAHDGVNVGVVEEGFAAKPDHNAELGHFYPTLYHLDADAEFEGVCFFHDDCIEGLIAARSLYQRAATAREGTPFWHWKLIIEQQGIQAHEDGRICRALLGRSTQDDIRGDETATMLVGYYLAQLVHIIALYPLSPEKVIIGGRMATADVLHWTRQFVLDFWNGYPLRPHFQNISQFIVKSDVPEPRTRELHGALAIAANHAKSSPIRGSK